MPLQTLEGTVSNPSITNIGDTNTGIYFPAADTIGLVEGGTEVVRIDSSGNVGIGTTTPASTLTVNGQISSSLGSVSSPAYTFIGDPNTGIFSPTADTLAFVEGGTEALRINSSGDVGIGTTSPTRLLDVRGQGYFESGLVVSDGVVVNSPSQSLLHLRRANRTNGISWNDTGFAYASFIQTYFGVLELGGRQNGSNGANNTDPQIRIYDRGVDFPSISTTASGANAFLSGTDRRLFVSTSSLRYKKDIEPVEEIYADAILDLQAVYYRSKSLVDNPDWSWWGFIAEDVFKVDPRLVTYIEDPEDPDKLIPDGVQYDRISVLLQDVVKRQSLKISELEQRIYSLEQQVIS